MEPVAWEEVIGYIASLVVVVGLSMKSLLRLRIIGTFGSTLFLIYALVIEAYPIAITNVVIISIHAYYIRKLIQGTEIFETLRVRPDSLYLQRFLEFHADEIQEFQPGFAYEPHSESAPVFFLRDMVPAGLLIAEPRSDGTLEIQLDYATPQYRDSKLGRFVYSNASELFDDGVMAWSDPWSETHEKYLRRMGFEAGRRNGRTVLERRLGALK